MTNDEAMVKVKNLLESDKDCVGVKVGTDHVVVLCTDKAAKNRFSRIVAAKKSELGGIPIVFTVV